jgi:hypothetical protein
MKRNFLWAVMALTMATVALAHAGPKRAIAGTMSLVISDMSGDLATPINTAPAPPDIGRTSTTTDYLGIKNARGAPDLSANGTANYTDDRPRNRIHAGDSQRR